MTQSYRKIIVRFLSEENMNALSDKIFSAFGSQTAQDYKLLRNMKQVFLNEDSFDFVYKRNVRTKPREQKEWEPHWKNLVPFSWEKKLPWAKIEFNFSTDYSNEKLTELFEQNITFKTKSIFYPLKTEKSENLLRVLGNSGTPKYPIYIISKGRSDCCVTADHLIKMDVPFRIVIEKSEWEDYAAVYDENILLELDLSFRENYDTYIPDFDENKSKGSGPARNFVWHHAKNIIKSEYHWIMDDNIFGFNYYMDQKRLKAVDGTIFRCAEDFIDRYENIGISGLNYYMFAVPGNKDRPYVANTKVYSCLLINNNIPIRWAGRYNEDVDLCIRALKEGYSTIQFDAFLAKKGGTQTMGGGNTDAFYAEEGTLPKSNMLAHNHPDITHVQWRFQRWHHMTCYDIFDVYKDRTIGACIEDMMRIPVLNEIADADIIAEIMKIDFSTIKKWDIFEDIPEPKRTNLINILKYYRYTKDNIRIIQKLTEPPLLNCDYYTYLWDNDIANTLDNNIMLKLLSFGDENGVLSKSIDWEREFPNINYARLKRIKHIMYRNKYLLKKDIPVIDYSFEIFELDEKDHKEHQDSKARIINKFIKPQVLLQEPLTNYDKNIRATSKKQKPRTFTPNLVARYDNKEKTHDKYTLLIHGSEDFNNEKLFNENIKSYNVDEIINSVYYPIDLMSANYALEHKLMNLEFVPDILMHSNAAYKVIYSNMAKYADEGLLFVESITPDLEFLIQEFKSLNKKITVIKNNTTSTQSLEDW